MRKRLVGLVGAMVVAIAGTTFAGSTSQQGYVDDLCGLFDNNCI